MDQKERNNLDSTLEHVRRVQELINDVAFRLVERGRLHDTSKFSEEEFSEFARVLPQLKSSTYGSEEYERLCEELGEVLQHHYAAERHHPEHFEGGIEDMSLVDITEMLVDWRAASERHDDGNIFESIEKNQKRFGYTDELKQILLNTAEDLFPDAKRPDAE